MQANKLRRHVLGRVGPIIFQPIHNDPKMRGGDVADDNITWNLHMTVIRLRNQGSMVQRVTNDRLQSKGEAGNAFWPKHQFVKRGVIRNMLELANKRARRQLVNGECPISGKGPRSSSR
ncbi:hypothetical protein DFQ01_107170 [Paenibacillus cellulosilyticus]|uniref:Uncharacterized protein n=1 Tax=Paenibacillus cellulosilyticus TaxID=375489 RepID=A0A2V2YU50_9BACL|nr:hypothetical protein DFQ01_107170 [Paenibacillus cellulosilyticus]